MICLLSPEMDFVAKVDQRDVKNNEELLRYLYGKKPGETVTLLAFQDGKFEEIKLTLGEKHRKK